MATTTKTLTFGSPSQEFTTVPGATYVLGITFADGLGAAVRLEYALSGSPDVYGDVALNVSEGGNEYLAVGSKLRLTAISPPNPCTINADLTDKL